MNSYVFFLALALILPAGAQGVKDPLTTLDGQIDTFLISGILIVFSISMRVVMLLLSLPTRTVILVLSRIGMDREEARDIVLQIFSDYLSESIPSSTGSPLLS
jgi:hypothetical protein